MDVMLEPLYLIQKILETGNEKNQINQFFATENDLQIYNFEITREEYLVQKDHIKLID